MATRWQLRTWTKGTGATVEPAGAEDRPRTPARPGGLTPLPAKRPWAPAAARRASHRKPAGRLADDPRHRHALGYLDPRAVERLEALEAELAQPSAGTPEASRACPR